MTYILISLNKGHKGTIGRESQVYVFNTLIKAGFLPLNVHGFPKPDPKPSSGRGQETVLCRGCSTKL